MPSSQNSLVGRTAFWWRIKHSLTDRIDTLLNWHGLCLHSLYFCLPLYIQMERWCLSQQPDHNIFCGTRFVYGPLDPVKFIHTKIVQIYHVWSNVPNSLWTSMSSTSRFPLGLNWFVNGAVRPFCGAYNEPLKNREKIISSIPFYPALCHSVHLGKCSACMIRGILKEKTTEFNISIFSSPCYSVLHT